MKQNDDGDERNLDDSDNADEQLRSEKEQEFLRQVGSLKRGDLMRGE